MSQLNLKPDQSITSLEDFKFEPIKGYPMLHWKGKRPFQSTQYYPAQLKEAHGDETDGWLNKIFWGDNLQVMSHLLKKYRGQVDLVYIDPPFDSKADYKKKISLKGISAENDASAFEEKQYTDIWNNDEYLQFMYERLILIRELMAESGSIFVHCDWHKSHHIRCMLDEIFGINNFQNEIIWQRTDPHNDAKSRFGWIHDTIFWYGKKRELVTYNWQDVTISLSKAALKEYSLVKLAEGEVVNYVEGEKYEGRRFKLDDCTYKGNDERRRFIWRGATPSSKRVWPYHSPEEMDAEVLKGEFYLRDPEKGAARCKVSFLDTREGQVLQTIWNDTGRMKGGVDYPTQKPPDLLERIILAASNPGDLVFDCFMGSGTTQAVAMKLGRRFIGADINLGAIQTTSKRLLGIAADLKAKQRAEAGKLQLTTAKDDDLLEGEEVGGTKEQPITNWYTGFEVYNVNHYDVFRNPLEAKELLIKALEYSRSPATPTTMARRTAGW